MVHNVWIREIRAPFLLLPTIFVPIGIAIAWNHGYFDLLTAILSIFGVVSLHASVNVLNDYFDYRSGIDLVTTATPFSGGSRILPAKELTSNSVLFAGIGFLAAGLSTGFFFVYKFAFDPLLIGILLAAAVSIVAYSPLISTWGIGELIVGLNFGPMLLLGTYYVQTKTIHLEPILVGAVLGILTTGVLYINEFPDTDADMQKGRMHLIARWGKVKAAQRFKVLIGSAYLIIIAGVILGLITPFALLALITLPKARTAARVLGQNHDKVMELVPGMASMVMTTLWTGLLLLVAYIISGLVF